MSYNKKELEIHSYLADLHERYGNKSFIQFEKTAEVTGTQFLERIIGSINDRKVIKIYYHPFYEDKPYFIDVHPYILKEYRFRWYLIGLNAFKNQIRTYALDRIRDITNSDEIEYVDQKFNPAEYFRHSIGIMAPGGTPPLIKVAVQKTQAQYIISQPWHESQNLIEESDDEMVFSFRVHPTYEFKSLILGLGNDALVVEPESLRSEICRGLNRLISRYQQPVG